MPPSGAISTSVNDSKAPGSGESVHAKCRIGRPVRVVAGEERVIRKGQLVVAVAADHDSAIACTAMSSAMSTGGEVHRPYDQIAVDVETGDGVGAAMVEQQDAASVIGDRPVFAAAGCAGDNRESVRCRRSYRCCRPMLRRKRKVRFAAPAPFFVAADITLPSLWFGEAVDKEREAAERAAHPFLPRRMSDPVHRRCTAGAVQATRRDNRADSRMMPAS